jgi:putative ABC transport system permease protein
VLLITLRDLEWRRRRFAIAVLGTALVFAIALTIGGLSHGFDTEAQSAVSMLRADGWVVASGASGPFLGGAPIPTSSVGPVSKVPGITAAVPMVYGRKGLGSGARAKDIDIFGAGAGPIGMPRVSAGRAPRNPGEAAISTRLSGHPLGSSIRIADHSFVVVGRVKDATILAGIPSVFLTLADAQRLAFGNTAVISSIAITGHPTAALPHGVTLQSNHVAVVDLKRPLQAAHAAVAFLGALLFLVAALVVGSMVYLSALERQRDFAVLKATGVPSRTILGGLAAQAVIMSAGAAVIALGLSFAIVPFFPLRVDITNGLRLALPIAGIVVGLAASVLAIRRATGIDPALAFGAP